MAVSPNDRIASIDILRGLALFGVLMVNLVKEFRISIFAQFVPPGPESQSDRFFDSFVSYVFEMKAFALFSLLFGIGLAVQYDRLVLRERPLYWLLRRLLVLLGFGLTHLLLIWNGDILTEYALAGLLVLPLLREDKETIAICSVGLFAFYVFMPSLHLPIYWPDAATLAHLVESANRVYANGTLAQVIRHSLGELKVIFPLHVFVFPRTLALFLLGAYIWRSGLPQNLRLYRRGLLIVGLIATAIGLSLTLAVATDAFSNSPMFGVYFTDVFKVEGGRMVKADQEFPEYYEKTVLPDLRKRLSGIVKRQPSQDSLAENNRQEEIATLQHHIAAVSQILGR